METKIENQEELCNTMFDVLLAVYERWGVRPSGKGGSFAHFPENPIGKVNYYNGEWFITPRSNMWTTYQLTRKCVKDTSLANMASVVEILAQYFVGQDWLNKVEGSMRRMKAIQNALE